MAGDRGGHGRTGAWVRVHSRGAVWSTRGGQEVHQTGRGQGAWVKLPHLHSAWVNTRLGYTRGGCKRKRKPSRAGSVRMKLSLRKV